MKLYTRINSYLIAFNFVVCISAGMISNFSFNVFLVKIFCSVSLISFILVDIKINKLSFGDIFAFRQLKKIIFILLLFTGYLLSTLIYSSDPFYGGAKIFNFIATSIPAIFAFYYLIATSNPGRLKNYMNALVIITLVTVGYILIDYPFIQSTIYEFKGGRWSHVIYGRVIGGIGVALLLYMLRFKQNSFVIIYSILSAVAIYGLYLSSLRAGLISFIIVFALLVIWVIKEGKKEEGALWKSNWKGLSTFLIVTIGLILFIPKPEIIEERFSNLTQLENFEFGGDAPINSRIEEEVFDRGFNNFLKAAPASQGFWEFEHITFH